MSIRIMHTADYHVGMQFSGYGSIAQQLAEARVSAVERVVKRANRDGCDMFVVAGDLFDRVSVRAQLVTQVMDHLSSFDGSALLLLPGNHDYSEEQTGLWARIESHLPGHGLILNEKKAYPLDRYGLTGISIYPGPCTKRHSGENAIGWIDGAEIPSDRIAIGLAHGSLQGVSPDFDGRYYPMTQAQLQGTGGVDLWLLGHTHAPYPASEDVVGSRIFYPGTPEPDGMDCDHRGGSWILEMDGGGNTGADLYRPGKFRFADRQVDVRDGADLQRLLDEYSGRDSTILRLSVSGWIPQDDYDRYVRTGQNRLRGGLSDSVAYLAGLDLSELYPEIDEQLIDDEFTEGSFPHRLLREVAEDGSPKALQLAYEMVREVQEGEDR